MRDSSYAVATSSDAGTRVCADARANADLKRAGTGQPTPRDGTSRPATGGFAFDVSSPIDSATSASSATARSPARKLRDPSTPRLGGIRRRAAARRRDLLKRRSSSERFRQDSAATEPDPTPLPSMETLRELGGEAGAPPAPASTSF